MAFFAYTLAYLDTFVMTALLAYLFFVISIVEEMNKNDKLLVWFSVI